MKSKMPITEDIAKNFESVKEHFKNNPPEYIEVWQYKNGKFEIYTKKNPEFEKAVG